MKRSRTARRNRPTPDLETLIQLSQALGEASSRIEDEFWEHRLVALVEGLLSSDDDETLNAALDGLFQRSESGYDSLADLIEGRCESRRGTSDAENDILLISLPILAWSRYAIPSGTVPPSVLANVRVQLQAHILAAGCRIGLANMLFSPDQLPGGFSEVFALTDSLGKAALQDRDTAIDPKQLPETVNFLSDTRYLLCAVAVPHGAPIFRWQEEDGDRAEALRRWQTQGGEALRMLLPACASEPLLPLAFYAAYREADRASRPYALRAAADFLNAALGIPPEQLTAVVAPFHDHGLEEYRIGLALTNSSQVIQGTIWPLLEAEDESTDIPGQIEAVLNEIGVGRIVLLDQQFPMEFCDDCGAPLYPNPEGEPVHAELPEDDNTMATPRHLH